LNIQTSFLTPPFGFALFYLRGVADQAVRTVNMYKGVVPFIILQLLALGIVGATPALVNYLPQRTKLLAETAPPPLNPQLQFSMENYVANEFEENGDQIRAAISTMRGVDISYLPEDLRDDFTEGLDKAEEAFPLMEEIETTSQAVRDQADGFRPLHSEVRQIEADIRRLEDRIAGYELIASRADDGSAREARYQGFAEALGTERDALAATIPDEWAARSQAFAELTRAEQQARNLYRRTVDDAYEPLQELRAIIADTDGLVALGAGFDALKDALPGLDFDAQEEAYKEFESEVRRVEGTGDFRSALSRARRAIGGRNPDPEESAEFLAEADALYAADLAWRQRAVSELAPALATYNDAIKDTIGLRGQPKLPEEQALFVAADSAGHRDIALNF
ncbi:MAG: TRAP transporter large permease subunit, partial [Pseudomonadota bacterium]